MSNIEHDDADLAGFLAGYRAGAVDADPVPLMVTYAVIGLTNFFFTTNALDQTSGTVRPVSIALLRLSTNVQYFAYLLDGIKPRGGAVILRRAIMNGIPDMEPLEVT